MIKDFYYSLDRYFQSLLLLGMSVVGGYMIRFVIVKSLSLAGKRSDDIIVELIYNRIKGSWFLFIPLSIFLIVFPGNRFEEPELTYILKITQTLIIISVATIAIRLVNVIQDIVIYKNDVDKEHNVRERKIRTQISFIKKIFVVIIVTITVSSILLNIESVRHYGTALVTSAGVAGIIIGFAAQKTLANLLAGFQIAFTQPIKLDDAVVVENEWGWIEEINLTYVVVRIWDLRRLVVPITYFIEKPFQNWTRVTADLLGSVFLFVDYQIPLDRLREVYQQFLEQSPLWDGKVNVIQVVESTEKCIQIRLLMSARNSPDTWDLRCFIREKMIVYIQENYPESLPRFRAEFSEGFAFPTPQ